MKTTMMNNSIADYRVAGICFFGGTCGTCATYFIAITYAAQLIGGTWRNMAERWRNMAERWRNMFKCLPNHMKTIHVPLFRQFRENGARSHEHTTV